MEESPFKESNEPIMSNDTKAQKELNALKITASKYKNVVIDGVTFPSNVLTSSSKAPSFKNEPKSIEDVTEDERNWLASNINFIMTDAGDFIPVTSGNQLAFYQTLLRICYFILYHNIPPGVISKDKEFKLFNIMNLIEMDNCDTAYKSEFNIELEVNMKSKVDSKKHAMTKFGNFTEDMIYGKLTTYENKITHYIATVSSKLTFKTINDLKNYFDRIIKECTYPANNGIIKLLEKLNPIYLNHICKTTDTFSFYANSKAWLAKTKLESGPECAFNLIIKPVFIGNINITTWHSNFKDIELQMEQMSNKIKKTCEKYVFKKY